MKRPFIPTIGPNDPDQIRDLKRWCEDMVRYADGMKIAADGETTFLKAGVLSAVRALYGFRVYRTGGGDRWNVSGGAFTSQANVRRYPADTVDYDGDDPRARHTISGLPGVGLDTDFDVYAHIDGASNGAGSVTFSTSAVIGTDEYVVKIAEIEDNVVRQQMVGDQVITDADDLGEYWYSTVIGTHPGSFANSDPTPAGNGTGALVLTAGGASFDHGLWSDLGDAFPADAAGTFTDDTGTHEIRAELVDEDYAAQFWDGYTDDLIWDNRVLICDPVSGSTGRFENATAFVTTIATLGAEALKATDENLAIPNGFTARLATTSEAGEFTDGNSNYVKLALTTIALEASGGIDQVDPTDTYYANGTPGIAWNPDGLTPSFSMGLLIDDAAFQADIIYVIDQWLAGGSIIDHGQLLGLADFDHGMHWHNGTGNAGVAGAVDDTYTQNYATSALLTDHLRVPMIKDDVGVDQIDLGSGYLFYADGTTISVEWWTSMLNDSSGNDSVDWADRLLVNAAGATVLDWSGASVDLLGGVQVEEATITASATLDESDSSREIDATAGAVTVTLPAAPTSGQTYFLSCSNSDNTVTIARNGKTIFGNAADFEIFAGEGVTLTYFATNGDWR